MNFIKTSDESTKDILVKEGFTLLQKEGNFWVFLNQIDCPVNFSEEEMKEITYSNKLCF